MDFGDSLAGGGRHFLDVGVAVAALQLVSHDQPLLAANGHRKGGAHRRLKGRMAFGNGRLNILGIVVAAANDDQVFQPAGQEQLTLLKKAKVAGAQIGTGAAIGAVGAKSALALLLLTPIPLGHAGAGDPDLADLARRAAHQRVRVDDGYLLVVQGVATAHKRLGFVVARCGRDDPPLCQRLGLDGKGRRAGGAVTPGSEESRFGQPVAGVKDIWPEAVGGESLGELLQRFRPDRLSTTKSDFPAAQIQPLALLLSHLVDAHLIGKVGRAANRSLIAAQRPQPANGPLQEGGRWHQDRMAIDVHWLQDAADEAHVVVVGQPEDAPGPGIHLEALEDHLQIVDQVAVADHHALGGTGGAGGVLQKGQRLRRDAWRPPGAGRVILNPLCVQPAQRGQVGGLLKTLLDVRQDLPCRQRDLRAGVGDDALDAWRWPVTPGRIGRHGNDASVETTEEGSNEIQTRGIEEQRLPAGDVLLLEQGSDGSRPRVQLRVSHAPAFIFAIF